jgi:S-adenosylmethionine hydrolase
LPEEIVSHQNKRIATRLGELTCQTYLRDVPPGETGITIGSSGYGTSRFCEIAIQSASAAEQYGVKSGDVIMESPPVLEQSRNQG